MWLPMHRARPLWLCSGSQARDHVVPWVLHRPGEGTVVTRVGWGETWTRPLNQYHAGFCGHVGVEAGRRSLEGKVTWGGEELRAFTEC